MRAFSALTAEEKALFFLKLGLASTFLYAGIASFITPSSWIGFFPHIIRTLVPEQLLLNGWSAYEIALALWLVFGRTTLAWAAAIAACTFLAIIIPNIGAFDLIFRDVGLFVAAIALGLLAQKHRKTAN